MLINDLKYYYRSKNYRGKFSGIDHPDHCTDLDWFNDYEKQDFDYNFNSWGFRGPEYTEHIGEEVILCLGDSFTVNVGGPIEYSWPSLLQNNFTIPCLNFGMDGAGNDAIRLVYERALKVFNVKHTFVVYSFFHRRLESGLFKSDFHEHNENILHFKKQFIDGAFFQFLPPWCYTAEEQKFTNSLIDQYLSTHEFYWSEKIERKFVSRKNYQVYKGASWPSYDEFLKGAPAHKDMFENFKLRVCLYTNRDQHHLNLNANQLLADSLYEQFLKEETK